MTARSESAAPCAGAWGQTDANEHPRNNVGVAPGISATHRTVPVAGSKGLHGLNPGAVRKALLVGQTVEGRHVGRPVGLECLAAGRLDRRTAELQESAFIDPEYEASDCRPQRFL